MLTRRQSLVGLAAGALTALSACGAGVPGASDYRKAVARSGLDVSARSALDRLTASRPEAADIADNAQGLLIFPDIVKGGLGVGAATGDGVWLTNGNTQGYYRSVAVSYGLQAGITRFGYVMAFLDQASIDYVENSDGFEVGVGPIVTVADEGFARRFSTTTVNEGIVVFFVDQDGFFVGSGIEGTKITRLR